MLTRTMVLALAMGAYGAIAYAEDRDDAWVMRQVRKVKDSDTNEWRRIPWTASLLDARQASKREKQPMFLFTHDGNIETGRC